MRDKTEALSAKDMFFNHNIHISRILVFSSKYMLSIGKDDLDHTVYTRLLACKKIKIK